MATTNFTSGVTVIAADWLNDIDAFYYELFGTTGGLACIGDNANASMTIGLTINQAGNDNEILALKSSDVAHGMTTPTETDTFGTFKKAAAASGGLQVYGYRGASGVLALELGGMADAEDTNKATTAAAAVIVDGRKKSGATTGALAANGNILAVQTNGTTRFILDADGDSHQDVGTAWTNFDTHDDIALLDATSALLDPDTLRKTFTQGFLKKHKKQLEQLEIVKFNRDGHHFINWSRFQMLHMGATRWLADKVSSLETKMLALEAK